MDCLGLICESASLQRLVFIGGVGDDPRFIVYFRDGKWGSCASMAI